MRIVSATTPSGIQLVRDGDGFVQRSTAASLAFLRGMDGDFGSGGSGVLAQPYLRSAWVRRAINLVSTPITQVPLDFYTDKRGGEVELESPELKAFWDRPGMDRSGPMGRADFLEASIGWLKLCGECFWLLGDDWFVNRFTKERSGIIIARPDRMEPVFAHNRALIAWRYTDANGQRWDLDREQVVLQKFWNPYDDLRGASEYAGAQVAAEADYAQGMFSRNLAKANGDRGQTIVAKNGMPSPEQQAQIIAALRARKAAAQRGDWKDSFLPADVSIEDAKITAPDAAFVSSRLNNREEVALAMGVPPSMFNVKASYSIGAASDQYWLIANTCMPLANGKLADGIELVSQMFLPGRPRVCAYFDFDDHPVMQQVRAERLDSGIKLWNIGMPLKEASDYLGLGLPRVPGDEIGYIPFSAQPIGAPEFDPASDPALGEVPALEDEPAAAIAAMQRVLKNGPVEKMQAALQLGARTVASIEPKALSPKRQALWERHMRSRAKAVKIYHSKIGKVLMEARRETLAKIAKLDARSLATRDGAAGMFTFDLAKFKNALIIEIRKAGAAALQMSGDGVMAEVGETGAFNLAPDTVQSYLAQRDKKIADIADSTYERIKDTLSEGFDAGESTAKLAERIKAEFNGISSERAMVIAQTETSAAYGVGRAKAMEQAGVQFKQWLTSGNGNVRATHIELEGKVLPLDEAFQLSDGDQLQNPGDPNGRPENVINCHCVCIAVKDESFEFEPEMPEL